MENIMEHATEKHTPQEIVDFIVEEVLNPFPESLLYDDYQEDWEKRHENNDDETA